MHTADRARRTPLPPPQALDGLPNCVFDASGPLRQYTAQARAGGFLTKMAELSAVGAVTGTATSLLSQGAVELHRRADPSYEPSVAVPSVGRSSAGLAAFFAISANTRCGEPGAGVVVVQEIN